MLCRVFLLEVLARFCGGTRQVISSIEEGPAARKILRRQPLTVSDLGLPSEAPTPAPARIECAASPLRDQGERFPTGPPPSDACEPLPVDTYDQRLPPHLDTACPLLTDALHQRPPP